MIPLDVDFAGGWNKVWSAVSGVMGQGLANLLTAIGVILIVAAIFKWFWDRRRGGGGGGGTPLVMAIVIGTILAAPQVVIPIFLKIVDWVANAALNLL